MKILEVVNSLGIGGTERTCINFSLGLKRIGHDVRVFALKGGDRENILMDNFIPLYFKLSELCNDCDKWYPDVIHIHNHGVNEVIVTELYKLFPNARICEQNVFGLPSNYFRLNDTFVLSTWCKWNYLNFKNNESINLYVLPNPTNSENFYPATISERESFRKKYNIPNDAIVLLRIGQPFVAKWNEKIVDIFCEIKKKYPNVFLLFVGAPSNIIKRAQKYDSIKGHWLSIEKMINDEDLRLCYGSADIFLHMARIGESFGIVLTEAMLCELPVVTINTPYCDNSQSEIVGSGGIVANRYGGILKALEMLIVKAELREKLGKDGRQSVIDRFSVDKVVDQLVRIVNNDCFTESRLYTLDDVKKYLNNAVDKPIPFAANLFKSKRLFLRFMPEKLYRYLFRLWCRVFDKSVQL